MHLFLIFVVCFGWSNMGSKGPMFILFLQMRPWVAACELWGPCFILLKSVLCCSLRAAMFPFLCAGFGNGLGLLIHKFKFLYLLECITMLMTSL